MALDQSKLENAINKAFADAQTDKTAQAQSNMTKALAKAIYDFTKDAEVNTTIDATQINTNVTITNQPCTAGGAVTGSASGKGQGKIKGKGSLT